MTEKTELDILEELGKKIGELIAKVEEYNIPRANFSAILENEGLLSIYHKGYGKIAKPLAYIKNLRIQFAKWYESSPQLAIDEVKKRLHILVNLMNVFSSKEVIRLRRITLILNKTEIDEIHKCMADVNGWTNYALTNKKQENRIDFFFNRLVAYLKGGTLDGVQFLGLFSHFRDSELAKELLTNDAVKRLRMYKKQMEFFRMTSEVITKALQNPGWEGFLGPNGFYYNLRKGKKYVKMVREEFENEEFASYLERLHEKIHEAPEAWGGSLIMLSKKLNDHDYQNKFVIYPAMQALLALFQRAIDRISKSEVGFKEIDAVLGKLENEIERRKRRLLKEDIKNLKREFDKVDNPVADEMAVIMPALMDYAIKLGFIPEQRLTNIFMSLGSSRLWLRKYGTDAQRFLTNSNVTIGAILFEASNLDKLMEGVVNQINAPLFNQAFISYIELLEARINSVTMPQLAKIIEFIKNNENQLTVPLSTREQLLPEVQELLLKMQDKLVNEFKETGIDLTKPAFG